MLGGCALDIVSVKQAPATLTPVAAASPASLLATDVTVPLGTGFPTKLKQGTKWQRIGTLPQGDVYSTRDQVLTVEASNIHEAQLVVSGGNVVGFYLPVERTFAPAKTPTPLTLTPQP